jgi:branched-chain amino acid transport system substrate-binding protein
VGETADVCVVASTFRRRRLLGSALGGAAAASVGRARRALALAAPPVRIGYSLSATGPNALGAGITQAPNYLLWREQVNARGGLLVKDQGRRPIEYVAIDDRSDVETATRHYEKIMSRQPVDLILAPWGTKLSRAVAPLADRYGYPLLAPTMLTDAVDHLKRERHFVYAVLQPNPVMVAPLAALLKSLFEAGQVRRLGIAHVDEAFGNAMMGELSARLGRAQVPVAVAERYRLGAPDLSQIVKMFARAGVDAFVGVSYPPDSMLLTSHASALRFNPPFYFAAVGTAFASFRDAFHGADGVLGFAGWNPKVQTAGAAEYFAAHKARNHQEPDRWASAFVYASLQILETCVATAGLDRPKIKEMLDTQEFQTIAGPIRFIAGVNATTPGMIGQWQKGEFEIVAPATHATGKLVFPKPAWA